MPCWFAYRLSLHLRESRRVLAQQLLPVLEGSSLQRFLLLIGSPGLSRDTSALKSHDSRTTLGSICSQCFKCIPEARTLKEETKFRAYPPGDGQMEPWGITQDFTQSPLIRSSGILWDGKAFATWAMSQEPKAEMHYPTHAAAYAESWETLCCGSGTSVLGFSAGYVLA